MSARTRMIVWFILMVLLLSAVVLIFVLAINGVSVTDDPAGRLVQTMIHNAENLEFEHGHFDWDNIYMYRRGVYCTVYDEHGNLLVGAAFDDTPIGLPFEANTVRTVTVEGQDYFLYDTFVDMSISDVWMRGVISADDNSGLLHTILILSFTLLPALLLLTILGGWLIARDTFRPMEQVLAAADSISDGKDLSARIELQKGSREMLRLSSAFDRMFRRLELSFRAEQQFVSDASHELRTPITVLLAECDRARRKCETKEDFLAAVSVIEEQGHRMSELVQTLLSLTRLQHGTDIYPLRSGDLSEFTEACCGDFPLCTEKHITLRTDVAPGLRTSFNPTLLARLIRNLLQNACQYGKEDGHILVTLRQDGEEALLTVQDDGIGIEPELQDKIWQRFWQADPARSGNGGAGLGLAMVREIAEFHGGSTEVQSEPGRGSLFTVRLPMRKN